MFWRTERSSASTLDRTRPARGPRCARGARGSTGCSETKRWMRARHSPWTSTFSPPSDSLRMRMIIPIGAGPVERRGRRIVVAGDRAARPGSRADRRTPAPWPPPPSRPAASPAAARSCTGRRPGPESAAAGERRGSADPLQTAVIRRHAHTVSRATKNQPRAPLLLWRRQSISYLARFGLFFFVRRGRSTSCDIAQTRPRRSAATSRISPGQDHRGRSRIDAGAASPDGRPAAPCWSRPRAAPLPSVASPARPARSLPSGRQFWPSKRATPAGGGRPDRAVAGRAAIACTSSLARPSFSLQVRSWPSCQRLTPDSDA